jgi:ribosomal protein S16
MGNRSRSKRYLGVVERLSNSPPQREVGSSHLKLKNEMIAKKIHKGIEMSVN